MGREFLNRDFTERDFLDRGFLSRDFLKEEVVSALSYDELILTTGADGEESTVSEGGIYTFSTGITPNAWIRKEAFDVADADLVHDATISGTVVPASETPAFTDTATNSGTITSDGTTVTFDADVTSTSTANSALFRTFPAGSGTFFEGRISVSTVGAVDNITRCFIFLRNGARVMVLNLHQDAGGGMRLTDLANAEIGIVNASFDLLAGPETFIEALHDSTGQTKVWKGHEANPILEADYLDNAADAVKAYSLANANPTANVTSECTMRNAKFLRLN